MEDTKVDVQEISQGIEEQVQATEEARGGIDGLIDDLFPEYKENPPVEVAEEAEEQEEAPQVQAEKEEEKLAAPEVWGKEEKDAFNKLPREAQEASLSIWRRSEQATQKKFQEAAEMRKAMEPWVAHIQHLQQNPDYFNHVFKGYSEKKETIPQEVLNDPLEQIKWEAAQKAKTEIMKELAPITQQQALDRVRMQVMQDPAFTTVQNSIVEYVKSLPPSVGQVLYQKLDQDPQAYLEFYQNVRSKLSEKKEEPVQKKEVAVKREEKPRFPLMESGKSSAPQDAPRKKSEEVKELRKRVRDGKASSKDIGDLLEKSGMIDKLLDKNFFGGL